MAEKEIIELMPIKDILTNKLNYWQEQLIERTIKWEEAQIRREENPTQEINTQAGMLTINAILDTRVAPIKEARSHVTAIKKMLAMDEAELAKLWADENIVSPLEVLVKSPVEMTGEEEK